MRRNTIGDLRTENVFEMIKELKDNMKYLLASNIVLSILVIILAIMTVSTW